MNYLPTNIKLLRKQNNLSQIGLSDVLGVQRTYISHWETKFTLPSNKELVSLSNHFKVSIDWVVRKDLRKATLKTVLRNYNSVQKKLQAP